MSTVKQPNSEPPAPLSTSTGSLGIGYVGVTGSAISAAIISMYNLIKNGFLTKEQSIQNSSKAAQDAAKEARKAGRMSMYGAFFESGAQAGVAGFSLGVTAKNYFTEQGGAKALQELKDNPNARNLRALSNKMNTLQAPDDALLGQLRDPAQRPGVLNNPEAVARFKNRATPAQRTEIARLANGLDPADPAQLADQGELRNLLTPPDGIDPARHQQLLHDNYLEDLAPAEIDHIAQNASPQQRRELLNQNQKIEQNKTPLLKAQQKQTQSSVNSWNSALQMARPTIEAAGHTGKGIYDNYAAEHRANEALNNAAMQAANGAISTTDEFLGMVKNTINGLFQTQATIAQASR